MNSDDQMPGWEDVPRNGNFTEYVPCNVELSTCDSEQKENEDSENSEDDEVTEIELKLVCCGHHKTFFNINVVH